MRSRCAGSVALALLLSGPAPAQNAAGTNPTPADDSGAVVMPEVNVVGEREAPLRQKVRAFDQSRDEVLLPHLGATSTTLDQEAIQALPQGENTPIDRAVLQAPGVSADSALNNPDFHIRNEYSNVQYRINGIPLPQGINGLGAVLDTGFIDRFDLLDGVLPAQYGLRTSGVIDINSKTRFDPGGTISLLAGSRGTISLRLEYGGAIGDTQYYFSGHYFGSDEGLENATRSPDPIHDHTDQGKYFGYVSTLLNESNRLTFMSGGSISRFEIPNIPGQPPLGDYVGTNLNSAAINEREHEFSTFNLLALQTKGERFDGLFSVYSAYANLHFLPDIDSDLAFDDVATDVVRRSLINGADVNAAYRLSERHTLRAGINVSAENTNVVNTQTVLPLDDAGTPLLPPRTFVDANSKLGWNIGFYLQDEWRLTEKLTLNAGLRFDQLYQFVDANQLSPRVSLIYQPGTGTTLHAGYARYFTPPSQIQAAPTNLALFANTTLQPEMAADNPVRPERSHYFDVGMDQTLGKGLSVGIDLYYKLARNLLDDGQFGQAPVLTQFNYDRGWNKGIELKAKYEANDVRAYVNLSVGQSKGKKIVSNQFLFNANEYAYIATHAINNDDDQTVTASAGASYRWEKLLLTADGYYGSGLRTDFANLKSLPPYVQVNLAVARQFELWNPSKPLTMRLSAINLIDRTNLLRSNTGVGDFASQYGPRRGLFITLSQPI